MWHRGSFGRGGVCGYKEGIGEFFGRGKENAISWKTARGAVRDRLCAPPHRDCSRTQNCRKDIFGQAVRGVSAAYVFAHEKPVRRVRFSAFGRAQAYGIPHVCGAGIFRRRGQRAHPFPGGKKMPLRRQSRRYPALSARRGRGRHRFVPRRGRYIFYSKKPACGGGKGRLISAAKVL